MTKKNTPKTETPTLNTEIDVVEPTLDVRIEEAKKAPGIPQMPMDSRDAAETIQASTDYINPEVEAFPKDAPRSDISDPSRQAWRAENHSEQLEKLPMLPSAKADRGPEEDTAYRTPNGNIINRRKTRLTEHPNAEADGAVQSNDRPLSALLAAQEGKQSSQQRPMGVR